MENIRFFLILSLLMVCFFIFTAWEKENNNVDENYITQDFISTNSKNNFENNISKIENNNNERKNYQKELIEIKTDLFNIKINPKGGDIVHLDMNNYLDNDKKNNFVLFNPSYNSKYTMQTGLISKLGPDSHKLGRVVYASDKKMFDFRKCKKGFHVDLTYSNESISVIKRFIFKRNSYKIDIKHIFRNNSDDFLDTNIYARIRKKI